jgi:MGT family glycosyltransferase
VKVLAYTSPARGHLYPIVPLLAELTTRGHRASVVALSGELEHLTQIGVEGWPIDAAVQRIQIEDWQARSRPTAGISVLKTFARRAPGETSDLERAIERTEPDVLVIDVNCWGAATVAEAAGLPWAMYSPYLLPLRSREAPPFGLGLRPRNDALGKLRDALIGGLTSVGFDRTVMPTINSLRVRNGLPKLDHYSEVLERPPLMLMLTAEGFEYPRSDWPANVRMVGPMHWAPAPAEPRQAPSSDASLAELSDPLVLVTCSTERQRDKRLLHVALEALPPAGMSVIGTSAAHDPETFKAPPGSRVVRFASHEAILERAACVVCHGGMGITQKALAAKVPVVVVPCGRDQLDTASRVEFAEAGVRLSPRRLNPERLLDAVHTAMTRRAGAQRMSRAFAQAGGAVAAADAIEALESASGVVSGASES